MSDGETQRIVDAVADATRTGMGRVSPAELDHGWERLESALSDGKYPSVPIVAAAMCHVPSLSAVGELIVK